MSRKEWYREGRVPLHTLRADIDYGDAEAKTTFGRIGVKVWIYKGDFSLQVGGRGQDPEGGGDGRRRHLGPGPASTRSWRPTRGMPKRARKPRGCCRRSSIGLPRCVCWTRRVGSGNFLYVALEKLKTLEQAAKNRAITWSIAQPTPRVHPRQLFGIEVNEYAHQLASTVVWIGYLQWKRRQGDYTADDPVLEPLKDNILNMDAILQRTPAGRPFEPEWPEPTTSLATRRSLVGSGCGPELKDAYVDALFEVWDGRVRRESDLCCYWFEKAREMIATGKPKRAGLLATHSIRGGANRRVLGADQAAGRHLLRRSDRTGCSMGRRWHLDRRLRRWQREPGARWTGSRSRLSTPT